MVSLLTVGVEPNVGDEVGTHLLKLGQSSTKRPSSAMQQSSRSSHPSSPSKAGPTFVHPSISVVKYQRWSSHMLGAGVEGAGVGSRVVGFGVWGAGVGFRVVGFGVSSMAGVLGAGVNGVGVGSRVVGFGVSAGRTGDGVKGAGVGLRVVGFGVSSMAGGTGDGVKQTLQKWAERAATNR